MKFSLMLALLLVIVSCKGGGQSESEKDPLGPSAGFNIVLLDAGNNVITSVNFPTPLNPNYDTQIELDFTLKNIGTDAGDIVLASESPDFQVTTLDNKCNGTDVLQPGESCAIKVLFKYIIQPDGLFSGNLNGWSDGIVYKSYLATGTIATSI